MFKFELNGVAMNDHPDGWNSIDTSVKRDEVTGILLYDANLNFVTYGGQDLYIALKAAWDADKFGQSILDIYQQSSATGYQLIHSGTIFHSDLKFALINNSISFKTDDRGYYAMINNNKSIDVSLDTSVSKNGVNIGPCPSFQLTMHNESSGSDYAQTRKAYKVYDVLNYLVRFMTDGKLTFQSNTFGTGGPYEGYCILSGNEIANHNGAASPRTNWRSITEDLVKLLHVQFSIIGPLTAPILKCETWDQFFNGTQAFTIPTSPDEVTLTVKHELLYSNVQVGSDNVETDATLVFPDVQTLISYRMESLHFSGTNNIDRTLDLSYNLVTSNAALEVVLRQLSGHDSYWEKNFIVQYVVATNKSYQSNWSALTNVHLYNESLINVNVLNRWSNAFPSDIVANFYNVSNARFYAMNRGQDANTGPVQAVTINYVKTTPIVRDTDFTLSSPGETVVVPYYNDYTYIILNSPLQGLDITNNYGGSTPQGNPVPQNSAYYTAPSNGLYSFGAQVSFTCTSSSTGNHGPWRDKKFGIRFKVNNSINFDCPVINIPQIIIPNQSNYIFSGITTGAKQIYLTAGSTVQVHGYYYVIDQHGRSDKWSYNFDFNGIYFYCNGLNIGSGTINPADKNNYKCLKADFTYPLNLDDYTAIRNAKDGIISVPISPQKSINGWVENIRFKHESGEATFTLLTDGNTVYR